LTTGSLRNRKHGPGRRSCFSEQATFCAAMTTGQHCARAVYILPQSVLRWTVFISIYLSIFLSTYLCMYVCVYLYIYLSIYLYIHTTFGAAITTGQHLARAARAVYMLAQSVLRWTVRIYLYLYLYLYISVSGQLDALRTCFPNLCCFGRY